MNVKQKIYQTGYVIILFFCMVLSIGMKVKASDTVFNNNEIEEYAVIICKDFDKDTGGIMKVEKGKFLKLDIPKKKGYKFIGWYNGHSNITDGFMVTDNITINAKWEKIKLSKPKLKSIKGRKITIQSVKGADGYQIQYGKKYIYKKISKNTSFTIKNWHKKMPIRIRAYAVDSSDNKVYGKWMKKSNQTILSCGNNFRKN